jgi:hypothetical protein
LESIPSKALLLQWNLLRKATVTRFSISIVSVTCLLASSATAQWPDSLRSGTRIGITLVDTRRFEELGRRQRFLTGRLEGKSSDTLYVRVTDSLPAIPVPHDAVRRLYVSRGVPSRLRSGVRTGIIHGALSAVITTAMSEIGGDGRSTGEAFLEGGAIGLGGGFLMGVIFRRERWRRVQPVARAGPSASGMEVGLRIAR